MHGFRSEADVSHLSATAKQSPDLVCLAPLSLCPHLCSGEGPGWHCLLGLCQAFDELMSFPCRIGGNDILLKFILEKRLINLTE